jgi:hypothetical protein
MHADKLARGIDRRLQRWKANSGAFSISVDAFFVRVVARSVHKTAFQAKTRALFRAAGAAGAVLTFRVAVARTVTSP